MKTLSAIAREMGVSAATVSYVYHGKWRENRIRPEVAARVRQKLEAEGAAPDALGRQLRSGRTQAVGVMLPHLEQAYFLKLLAGIESRLAESGYMLFLGIAHSGREARQVALLERMLARRVDALLMAPRPAADLDAFLATTRRRSQTPLVFADNYLPRCRAARATSDNRWGARETVRDMLRAGRRRIVFFGWDPTVAALWDRYEGYCDALKDEGLPRSRSLTIWRHEREERALDSLRELLRQPRHRPDAIFATSFLNFLPALKVVDQLGLRHPDDVLLTGFDEPMESWAEDTVRRVIREPLWSVIQRAGEIGREAVELALAAVGGDDVSEARRLIRPDLSWRKGPKAKRTQKMRGRRNEQ